MSERAVTRRGPIPAPGWRVEVQAIEVDRWSIAQQVVKVRAVNATQARIEAARQVARAAGVPPWRTAGRRVYTRCRVVGPIEQAGRGGRHTGSAAARASDGQELLETARPLGAQRARNFCVPFEGEKLS